ncbi:MAG: hypothetical protein RBU21_05860 [FCB group bacterium]|jgi:hypothetical protein|nr:hypothetical protein [FCB group bacterium]
MPSFSFVYQNLLWITVPAFCIALLLLVRCILGVVRLIRRSIIARVPLVEEHVVSFSEAGKVVLCNEGPRISLRAGGLRYRLMDEDGTEVPSRLRLFRAVTSGVSKARMELRTLRLPRPGRYVLHVEGLGEAQPRDRDYWIVFTKPHLLKTIGYVVAMVLTGGTAIVSLVFSLLRIFGIAPE